MRKLYTVKDAVTIPGIGLRGPLTTPTELDYISVLNLVKGGCTVYQHNPYNLQSKIRINLKNINTITFKASDGIREQAALARKRAEAGKRYVDVVRKGNKPETTKSEAKEEKYTHENKNNKFDKKNKNDYEKKVNKEEDKVTTSDFEKL